MKIRTRLTYIATLIFGVVFSLASGMVYIMFYNASERIIYNELERSTRLSALFFLEEDELPLSEFQEVERKFNRFVQQNPEVRLYNEDDVIQYGNPSVDTVIDRDLLADVRAKGSTSFKAGDFYYHGIFYHDNQGDFVIFIKEEHAFFREQGRRLLLILVGVLLAGLVAIFVLSRTLSGIAYRPVSRVIDEVRAIELDSLDQSLTIPNTQDEIQELLLTFNDLLRRLADSFHIQRNFINYVSHEFRTPLAGIVGSLEVHMMKEDRSHDEQKQVIEDAIAQVYHIKAILNTLMELSGLRDEAPAYAQLRVDELIWDILEKDRGARFGLVSVHVEVTAEDQTSLNLQGNATQLEIAITNLLDNAAKYSGGKRVDVRLFREGRGLLVTIEDQGPGIPAEEVQRITRPFYRGTNVRDIPGKGIGLSISGIIFKQHGVEVDIHSQPGSGTTVRLCFPTPEFQEVMEGR